MYGKGFKAQPKSDPQPALLGQPALSSEPLAEHRIWRASRGRCGSALLSILPPRPGGLSPLNDPTRPRAERCAGSSYLTPQA